RLTQITVELPQRKRCRCFNCTVFIVFPALDVDREGPSTAVISGTDKGRKAAIDRDICRKGVVQGIEARQRGTVCRHRRERRVKAICSKLTSHNNSFKTVIVPQDQAHSYGEHK